MILHIDMDAFFASIEQAVNPKLKGKPLIVGSRGSRIHTVVCAASYEAKAYGINSGMPSKDAFRICPNLEFVPAEQGKYIWTSRQIFEILKKYGFQALYTSIDEFQLDIEEEPDPERLAEEIQKRIYNNFGITASIGIAENSILAKLGSKINKPNGLAILNQANLTETLDKIPVDKLRGVGEKTGLVLDNLGIKTCLDLYLKPASLLEQTLGKYGLNLYAFLHSKERFNLTENEENPKSIGHSYTFPRASETPRFLKAWIRLLSEMIAERLRKENLAARTIHLWLNGPRIGNFGAQKTFKQGTNDGHEIYLRCLKIMTKINQIQPKIRALGVSGSSLFHSQSLFLFKEQKRREELLKTVDHINSCHGDGSIYPAQVILTRKMA